MKWLIVVIMASLPNEPDTEGHVWVLQNREFQTPYQCAVFVGTNERMLRQAATRDYNGRGVRGVVCVDSRNFQDS